MIGKKVAIVGAHGSGKNTLANSVVAALKRRNVHVGLAMEGARSSPYLLARDDLSPTAQVNIFARQIVAETDAVRAYNLVIADRSVFDIIMYNRLFCPPSKFPDRCLAQAMEAFATNYASSYDAVFRMTRLYDPILTPDPMRPKALPLQREAHQRLLEVLDEFGVEYEDVPTKNPTSFVISSLRDKGIISR